MVDPLLSEVALAGRLTGLSLGKQLISSSSLCSSNHLSLFTFLCVLVACKLSSITYITKRDCYSGFFPLSLRLKDSPFSAVFTLSGTGNLFQHSNDFTANEYFRGSILAYWTARPCPPASCLVLSCLVLSTIKSQSSSQHSCENQNPLFQNVCL